MKYLNTKKKEVFFMRFRDCLKNKLPLILLGSSAILTVVSIILGFISSIINSMPTSTLLNVVELVMLCYLAFLVYKKSNNIGNLLTAYQVFILLIPIIAILHSLFGMFVYAEPLYPIQIISTIIEIIVLFLPMIIGINIAKSDNSISFLRKISLVETIIFGLMSIINIYRLIGIYRGILPVSGISQFPVVSVFLVYLSLHLLSKNIICEEKQIAFEDLEEESVAKNVIFTIITFGIYGYIWLYKISRKIKCLNNDNSSSSGEILCLLFVPFYMLYWLYTRNKTLKTQADNRNIKISDNATLYLVLALFGFNIISIALMQNDLNIVIKNKDNISYSQPVPEPIIKKETTDIEKLTQLADLKEKGIITEEEYNQKKQEILNRI